MASTPQEGQIGHLGPGTKVISDIAAAAAATTQHCLPEKHLDLQMLQKCSGKNKQPTTVYYSIPISLLSPDKEFILN